MNKGNDKQPIVKPEIPHLFDIIHPYHFPVRQMSETIDRRPSPSSSRR